MQALQKSYTGKGIVWLSVSSGKALSESQSLNQWLKDMNAAPSALVMDSDTRIAQLYGANTTPHIYIVDPKGKLIYASAIDDKRGTDPSEILSAKNYVSAALEEALAGKPVTIASTQPYGCSVKYQR